VLADVDLSLAAWLSAALPPRTEIDFSSPARRAEDRAGRHPVLSAFLYSVDEDTTGLPAGEIRLRDGAGRPAGILLPARRYAVTYLLTAWAGDPLTEHRLLGAVLVAHAGHDELGREYLRGVLAEADVCLPVYIGRASRTVAWDGAGMPRRSALALTVLAPAVPPLAQIAAPPAEQLELVARAWPPAREPGGPQPGGPQPELPQPGRRWRRTTRSEP
jgi:Pvc16 N-terminal domain